MKQHDIIVIGTSAGGIEALTQLLAPIKSSIPASIFIVLHLSPHSSNEALITILQKNTELTCMTAVHGKHIKKGHVYLAPVNEHLLIKDDHILLVRGARENGFRPAIDATFRSAAANYGSRVIGVILTGLLYDGIAGMEAIKRSGGFTIVQDPQDAEFNELPQNVLQHIEVDYCLPLHEIAVLLSELARRPSDTSISVPEDIRIEAEIAERMLQSTEVVETLGDRSHFTCPDCGGSLWQLNHGDTIRFRCHTGHAHVAQSLLSEKDKQLEETLWIAMRVLEERKNMLTALAAQNRNDSKNRVADSYQDKIEEAKMHIDRIKAILTTDVSSAPVLQQEREDSNGTSAAARR
jgi:two-component system, chemotaxis family, protein-glutamate methylesterase/glutaminase